MSGDGSGLGVVHHRYVGFLRVSRSVGRENLRMLRRRRSIFDRRGEDVLLMRMRRTEGDARVGVGEERGVGRRVGNVTTRSRGNVSLSWRLSGNGEIVRCCSFPSSSTLTLICELWIHRIRLSAPCEEQRDTSRKSVDSPKFGSVASPIDQLSSSTCAEQD